MLVWLAIIIVFIPWCVVTTMWYISIYYRLVIHREATNKTTDFGVKILTIGDNPEVLKETILHSPKPPLVISRIPVDVPGNKVMPSNFDSKADFKGEQLEWARKAYPMEYTLYLDEDSICSPQMNEIPDADIVQFCETPIAHNWFIAAIEAHRIGFQTEQAIFEVIKPFYLWGGGFAIKRKIEDAITWNRDTITEDTAFIFLTNIHLTYKFSKMRVYNQAPQTFRALIKQRRRWASGALVDIRYHNDRKYKYWIIFRSINWGLWAVLAPLSLVLATVHPLFILPLIQTFIWSFVGARVMQLSPWWTFLATISAPVAAVVHSIGACVAFVSRPKSFDVTPKKDFIT